MPPRRRVLPPRLASAGASHAALFSLVVAGAVLGANARAAPPSPPLAWTIDQAASRVSFTLAGPGGPVQGVFKRWQAHAAFEPQRPAAGRITISIDTASLVTGAPTRDQALTGPQALGATRFPHLIFTSQAITPRPQGGYAVDGRLEVRGVARPGVAVLTALPGPGRRLEVDLALPADAFAGPGHPRPDSAALSVRLAARP